MAGVTWRELHLGLNGYTWGSEAQRLIMCGAAGPPMIPSDTRLQKGLCNVRGCGMSLGPDHSFGPVTLLSFPSLVGSKKEWHQCAVRVTGRGLERDE